MTTHGGRRPEEPTPSDPGRDGADGSRQPELAPVPAATRGGEDARRRGWFWHWNSLVTQYAPLIGLKGVGLLNSYTVWTDRREESPHRGYAFPSQQSEADFYGEDRAELIAINKILVALDLIEIRKEMVLRADPQGRRWKVPHNFYRVKDHDDGFVLSAREVLNVAALAERDKAVYRYVRRVFSPRFAPIDPDNPWHRILPEVRQTALWQALAARAAAEEGRASARTRAGHAARRANGESSAEPLSEPHDEPSGDDQAGAAGADFFVPGAGDTPAAERVDSDTAAVATLPHGETVVATTNRGSRTAVDESNSGSAPSGPTVVGQPNRGQATAVDPTNTTYHQERSTTTTGRIGSENEPGAGDRAEVSAGARTPGWRHPDSDAHGSTGLAGGPGVPPSDAAGEVAAVRAFQEANDRSATPAERKLLAGLAERFDPAARAAGASGWAWLADAAYEAVEAGSAFVAPRRLREIMGRWEREGYPHDGGGDRSVIEGQRRGRVVDSGGHGGGDGSARGRFAGPAGVPDSRLEPLPETAAWAEPGRGDTRRPGRRGERPGVPAAEGDVVPAQFLVAECGLASGAVWSAMLTELAAAGVARGEIEAWLRSGALLGRGGDGGPGSALVVGVPHEPARRRLASRYLPALRAAAAALGLPVEIELAVTRDWLVGRGVGDTGAEKGGRRGQIA